MDANEIKNRITINDTIRLLEYYGGNVYSENDEYIVFNSICHNSDSHKLYLYKETNSLYCWSNCGSIDVISIVQQQEGLSFKDAIQWIEKFFNIGEQRGFGRDLYIPPKREIPQKIIDIDKPQHIYEETILNTFRDVPIEQWINEGITLNAMKEFGIKFDINNNGIIIPVRDRDNRLIGIRIRNLDKDIIENTGKYIPYFDRLNGINYKFKTTEVLYGLNINKKKIEETKRVIIFEGEKSVLKMKSWYGEDDISVATFGCKIDEYQLELLKQLDIQSVAFMYDYETEEDILKKFDSAYRKANLFFNVFYVKDYKGLINIKDSPVDRDKESFENILNLLEKYE